MKIFYIVAGLYFLPLLHGQSSSEASFEMSHYAFGPEGSLRLAFPSARPGPVYVTSLFGLKIESVVSDGKIVAGNENHIVPEEAAYATSEISGLYIYITLGESLTSVQVITDEGISVKTYELDLRASKIEIKYRIRYPDGSMGPLKTIVSRRFDSRPWADKKSKVNPRAKP